MVTEKTVVVAKRALRPRKDKPATGHTEVVMRLGRDHTSFQLPGDTLTDIGVQQVFTVTFGRDPAEFPFPTQYSRISTKPVW